MCQRGITSIVYKFFDQKFLVEQLKMKLYLIKNQLKNYTNQLLEKILKRKVHSPSIDNIWGADRKDTQLRSKFNKGFRLLLCVIDIYSKYSWVIPLKGKKETAITNAFQKNQMNQTVNQVRYGQIKAVKFTIDQ